MKWQSQAPCSTENPDLFFPLSVNEESKHAAVLYGLYCHRCPVRRQCLEEAMRTRSDGVWAGTTRAVRDALSRNRDRKSCPGCGSKDMSTDDLTSCCLACGLSWRIAP